jgi:hypothetical protein
LNFRESQGLASVEEALALETKSERRLLVARFNQLKGDLPLIHDDGAEAEAESCFRRSTDIARSQSAKYQELLSTTHQARLLANRNRRGEARAMLAIYN